MLSPRQFGMLAELVHEALSRFPCKPMTAEEFARLKDETVYMEAWEQWLMSEINHKIQPVELPKYEMMDREIEFLVEYYAP